MVNNTAHTKTIAQWLSIFNGYTSIYIDTFGTYKYSSSKQETSCIAGLFYTLTFSNWIELNFGTSNGRFPVTYVDSSGYIEFRYKTTTELTLSVLPGGGSSTDYNTRIYGIK